MCRVQRGANNRAEVVWRENFYMGINNGYAWFSYGPNTFMPKDKVQDPNWKYSDSGWTGLLLGSFTGKYGPFYYVRPFSHGIDGIRVTCTPFH
jgi:hypothetical protein